MPTSGRVLARAGSAKSSGARQQAGERDAGGVYPAAGGDRKLRLIGCRGRVCPDYLNFGRWLMAARACPGLPGREMGSFVLRPLHMAWVLRSP